MARFLTRWYAAVTWSEALRLAALDNTPIAVIRQSSNAELVHRTEWWAWWSDERLTTAIGLPESLCPESLSPDAVSLISEVWERNRLHLSVDGVPWQQCNKSCSQKTCLRAGNPRASVRE
jgi:hypothetical protein